jgi:hypothetical protein
MSSAVAEWLLQCSGVRLRSQACARMRGYGGRAVTVAGMATHRPSAPYLTCKVTGKWNRGCARPPFEGRAR